MYGLASLKTLIERGAELSFSGRGEGSPSASSSNFVFYQPNFSSKVFGFRQDRQTDRQTDRRTDRQTDRRNKYVLGLPCFKKNERGFCFTPTEYNDRYMLLFLIKFMQGLVTNSNLQFIFPFDEEYSESC